MKLSTITAVSVAMLAIAGTNNAANAKDWIETITLSKNGIDAVPVEVRANNGGYTSVKTASHRFLLKGRAKATSGERIGVAYFHSYPAHNTGWRYRVPHRDLGSGKRRDVTIPFNPTIKTNEVVWTINPVAACNATMNQLNSQGMSSHQVLSQVRDATARARFYFTAYAMKPKKAQNLPPINTDTFIISNSTNETTTLHYDVRVKCLRGPASGAKTSGNQQQNHAVPPRANQKPLRAPTNPPRATFQQPHGSSFLAPAHRQQRPQAVRPQTRPAARPDRAKFQPVERKP